MTQPSQVLRLGLYYFFVDRIKTMDSEPNVRDAYLIGLHTRARGCPVLWLQQDNDGCSRPHPIRPGRLRTIMEHHALKLPVQWGVRSVELGDERVDLPRPLPPPAALGGLVEPGPVDAVQHELPQVLRSESHLFGHRHVVASGIRL